MSKRKSKTVATGKGKSGCASVNGSTAAVMHIGAWNAEDVFNRGERCRILLVACGYMTVGEAMKVRARIDADYAKLR